MEFPNWFNYTAKDNFEKFLIPLAGQKNLSFLQLGVYTGDASIWMLQNINNIQLTDVDTWQGSDEDAHKDMDFDDVYKTYIEKVSKYGDCVFQWKMTTQKYLLGNYSDGNLDFIYVDAHHTSASAFLDCELSWPLLKSGGLMAIDDYEWIHPDGVDIHAPKLGIHMFLDRHEGEYKLLVKNQQVWIRKQ